VSLSTVIGELGTAEFLVSLLSDSDAGIFYCQRLFFILSSSLRPFATERLYGTMYLDAISDSFSRSISTESRVCYYDFRSCLKQDYLWRPLFLKSQIQQFYLPWDPGCRSIWTCLKHNCCTFDCKGRLLGIFGFIPWLV